MLDNILTKQSLALIIEGLVTKEHMTYMEAVLHFCEERQIDPLDIGKLISPALKSKIEQRQCHQTSYPKAIRFPISCNNEYHQ